MIIRGTREADSSAIASVTVVGTASASEGFNLRVVSGRTGALAKIIF